MKKIYLSILGLLLLFTTGCLKRDNLENSTIYTTVYPIEYITSRLYQDHSTIKSIYPNDTDLASYELTEKQIKDYSKANMYIFNGLSNEKNYVSRLFDHNKSLKIIDASSSMEYTYQTEELWLDPSNFLMLSLNIKNGLLEYIDNHYLKTSIESNYEALKMDISALDAKFNLLSESSDRKTILVDNNALTFLTKYGFTIISLDQETATAKTLAVAEAAIKNGTVRYIFTLNEEKLNDNVKTIQEKTNVRTLKLHSLSNLTDKERGEKLDYLSLANENIEQLKQELYN